MVSHKKHETILKGFSAQYKGVLNSSEQAMYVYLDDAHMICNKRFATLLGYKTPQELVKIKKPFIDALVDSSSQHALVNAYGNAMERCVGSSFPITWKTKSGKKVRTQVILVPVMYENHLLALHFIE